MYRLLALGVFLFTFLATPALAQTIRYVDQSATGADDGSSWANAFTDLQDALAAASSGDQVAVAEGTYTPSSTGDREASFVIPSRVDVYGGFPAGGGTLSQRDPELYETILSGDLTGNDGPDFAGNEENSYHVVRMSNVTDCTYSHPEVTVIFDGFIIRGGNATGMSGGGILYEDQTGERGCVVQLRQLVFASNSADEGGGMVVSFASSFFGRLVFDEVSFIGNRALSNDFSRGGGAIKASDEASYRLTFTDVVFRDNTAAASGGAVNLDSGLACVSSDPLFTNVRFYRNSADRGGGVYVDGGCDIRPAFTNSLFSGNEASRGGGVYLGVVGFGGAEASFTNVTFAGNRATDGGGVAAYGNIIDSSTESFYNNVIFWGNAAARGAGVYLGDRGAFGTFRHSLVQGVETGAGLLEGTIIDIGGNFAADPLFADADGADDIVGTPDDDLTLLPASPAVDEGDQTVLPNNDTDLGGAPRVQGLGVDIGAYEAASTGLEARVGIQGDPVTIGAGGGALTYRVRLANEAAVAQSFDAWVMVLLPNGNLFGPVEGPRAVTLAAGRTVGPVSLQANVPGGAPGGSYTALVRLGTFPDSVVAQGAFSFDKAAAAREAPMVLEDWHADAGLSLLAEVATSTSDAASSTALPTEVALAPAYPNPFGRSTTLGFALPVATEVRLAVFDVLGREVAVLAEGTVEAGRHEATLDGASLPSGVYLIRLEVDGRAETQRLTLLR